MTMISNTPPVHLATLPSRAQTLLAQTAQRIAAFRAARHDAMVQRHAAIAIAKLDAHLRRDIGLDAATPAPQHPRLSFYGAF